MTMRGRRAARVSSYPCSISPVMSNSAASSCPEDRYGTTDSGTTCTLPSTSRVLNPPLA
ncbi:hypothetical protein [Streptomyces sp. NPDC020681]|uniref:hypothetical protein n=1 Tax=Streptomyces sp. NPDC020681 TaxID=3365083 RepID=UPI0037AF1C73